MGHYGPDLPSCSELEQIVYMKMEQIYEISLSKHETTGSTVLKIRGAPTHPSHLPVVTPAFCLETSARPWEGKSVLWSWKGGDRSLGRLKWLEVAGHISGAEKRASELCRGVPMGLWWVQGLAYNEWNSTKSGKWPTESCSLDSSQCWHGAEDVWTPTRMASPWHHWAFGGTPEVSCLSVQAGQSPEQRLLQSIPSKSQKQAASDQIIHKELRCFSEQHPTLFKGRQLNPETHSCKTHHAHHPLKLPDIPEAGREAD